MEKQPCNRHMFSVKGMQPFDARSSSPKLTD